MHSANYIRLPDNYIFIPTQLYIEISYFYIGKPTKKEMDKLSYVDVTSTLVWEPYSDIFGEQEDLSIEIENLSGSGEYMRVISMGITGRDKNPLSDVSNTLYYGRSYDALE